MKMRYLLLPASLTFLLSSHALAEEDTALPPPEVGVEAPVEPGQADAIRESAPNLRDELGASDNDSTIDVRSYQRKDGAEITEYAVRGRVYKIKVQPAGGLPAYYLYDRDGDGTFERRLPGGGKPLSPPSWVVKEF